MLHVSILTLSAPPRFIFDRDYTGSPLPFIAGTMPAEFYPNQSLDHFASNEERTAHRWSQRYFEDASLWGGPGFPVFLALIHFSAGSSPAARAACSSASVGYVL